MAKKDRKPAGFFTRISQLFSNSQSLYEEPEILVQDESDKRSQKIVQLHERGRFEEALQLLEIELSEGGASEKMLMLKAHSESRLGNYSEAAKSIFAARQLNDGTLSPVNSRLAGEVYSRQADKDISDGKEKVAMFALNQAIRFDPENAELYYKRAQLNEAWEEPESIRGDLKITVKKAPDFIEAWEKLGNIEFALKNWSKSKSAYDQVLKRSPRKFDVLLRRGIANYKCDDFAQAEKDINSAISNGIRSSKAFEYRGYLNLTQAKYAQAYDDLTKAIELGALFTWTLAHRATALKQLGRLREALQDLNSAIESNDKTAWYLKNRALILDELGHPSKALWDIEAAIRLEPTNADFSAIRANLLKKHPVYGVKDRKGEQQSELGNSDEKESSDLVDSNLELPTDSENPEELILNWEPLPPGWWRDRRLRKQFEASVADEWLAYEFLDRLDFLDTLRPEKICRSEFNSRVTPYYLYHFKNHVVAECPGYGNAVYVLEGTANWSRIFRLTKHEIRAKHGNRVRVIRHTKNWKSSLQKIVSG